MKLLIECSIYCKKTAIESFDKYKENSHDDPFDILANLNVQA